MQQRAGRAHSRSRPVRRCLISGGAGGPIVGAGGACRAWERWNRTGAEFIPRFGRGVTLDALTLQRSSLLLAAACRHLAIAASVALQEMGLLNLILLGRLEYELKSIIGAAPRPQFQGLGLHSQRVHRPL